MAAFRALADLRSLLLNDRQEGWKATLEALPALWDADPNVLRTEDGEAFLKTVFDEAGADGLGADVIELALQRGAFVPSLREIVSMWCHDEAQRLRMTERAIELGGRPSDTRDGQIALACAAPSKRPELVRLLVQHADKATLQEALLATLQSARPEAAFNEEILLAAMDDVSFVGASGLAPVHVAAVHADPARLERLLAKGAEPSMPLRAELSVTGEHCSSDAGIALLPTLHFCEGSTALDVVEQMLGLYRTFHGAYGHKGATAQLRAARLASLERKFELLRSRKAEHGTPLRKDLPAWTGEIEGLLVALAQSAGLSPARALRAAWSIGYRGIGPWTYFVHSLQVLGPDLMRTALGQASASCWLGAILAGKHITAKKPKSKGLSKESQTVIKNGGAFAERDGATLMVWMPKPGLAEFVVLGPDRHEILASDAASFIRRELGELGVDPSGIEATSSELMRGPAGGPSFHPRRLRAGDQAPSPTAIDRIGGLPLGFDETSWPRREGKPMHHVLTLDLERHPSLRVPGKRAVALFLSSPSEHQALGPNSDHARVVLLGEAELAKGEPSWPSGLEGTKIPAKTLLVDGPRAATRRERLAHAHAAWMPTFLQEEEGVWDQSPGDFVLQFDAEFVPSVSFGDAGVFYVFTKTAWFQCH